MPTSTTIPFYKQTKNLRTLTISGGNAVISGTTGTVTWSTPVDLATVASGGTGTFEAFDVNLANNSVSIRPADSTMENMAGEYDTFDATIQEICPAGALSTIAAIANQYDYIRVTAGYAATGALLSTAQYVSVVGKRRDLTTGLVQGKNVDRLTLEPASKAVYLGPVAGIY